LISTTTGTRAAHNTFMQVLVEQGIIGALLYMLLSVWVLRQLWQLKQMDKQGLSPQLSLYRAGVGCALTSAYIAGMFSGFLKAEVNIWLLALLAALFSICEKSLEEKQEETRQEQKALDFLPAYERPNRFAFILNHGLNRKRML
jgi:O-antigen ligase